MKKLLLLVMLLTSTAAAGADENGTYTSVGTHSCGEFVELQEKGRNPDLTDPSFTIPQAHSRGWIAGFITGFNWQAPSTRQILGDSDFTSALLWLEDYCRSNPWSDLSRGMEALTEKLFPDRHKTAKEAGP